MRLSKKIRLKLSINCISVELIPFLYCSLRFLGKWKSNYEKTKGCKNLIVKTNRSKKIVPGKFLLKSGQVFNMPFCMSDCLPSLS